MFHLQVLNIQSTQYNAVGQWSCTLQRSVTCIGLTKHRLARSQVRSIGGATRLEELRKESLSLQLPPRHNESKMKTLH